MLPAILPCTRPVDDLCLELSTDSYASPPLSSPSVDTTACMTAGGCSLPSALSTDTVCDPASPPAPVHTPCDPTTKLQHRAALLLSVHKDGYERDKVLSHLKWRLAANSDDWRLLLPTVDQHSLEWLIRHLARQRGEMAVAASLVQVSEMLELWALIPKPPQWSSELL